MPPDEEEIVEDEESASSSLYKTDTYISEEEGANSELPSENSFCVVALMSWFISAMSSGKQNLASMQSLLPLSQSTGFPLK
ncbi:hypothetical protein ACHAXM_010675 [Skeletonema potamos]